MEFSLASLASLVRDTIADPRAGARRVLALPVPHEARWMALLLVVVLSVLLTQAALQLFGATEAVMGPAAVSPFLSGGIQAAALVIVVVAVDRIGRMFGGRGRFDDALLLVTWLQVVMICLQVAQLVALIVLPPLAGLITLGSFAVFFWVLTGLVAELHGFRSRRQVFAGILASLFALSFAMALLVNLLGVDLVEG